MLTPVLSLGRDLAVEWLDAYSDGTIMAAIRDARKQKTHVCIDGRTTSPTAYRLFERARHPNQSVAVLVGLGSIEEGILVPLLSRYCDSPYRRSTIETDAPKEETQQLKVLLKELLIRYGEPPVPVNARCPGDSL